MVTPAQPSPGNLERFVKLLWKPGEVREVRILKHNKYGHTASGYFDAPDKLAAATSRWDGRANCYITLNPVDPALLARAINRIVEHAEHTTSDTDILSYHWLFLDIDPVRPSGISSTDAETACAKDVLDAVVSYLSELGWPAPLTALSGNGYHALFPIELPNASTSTELFKRVLTRLAERFSTEQAHLDTSVYNPARLAALSGTRKVKGDATPDRPHRHSALLHVPDEFVAVTKAQLALVAGETSEQPRHKQSTQHQPGPPLAQLLQQSGIAFREQHPDANEITWYHLEQCPFHDDGRHFECGVGQKLPDGPYAGHCSHRQGQDKGWQEWKVALGLETRLHSGAPVETSGVEGDDLGLTRRFADAITAQEQFALDAGLRLYIYRDGVYQPDGERHIARLVKDLSIAWGLSKSWTTHRVREVTAYISTDAPSLWGRPPGDQVNVKNGILHLTERRLEPHSPTFLSSVQLPVAYDPQATCSAWERQIQQTVPLDTQVVVWEILAWMLLTDSGIKKAVLFLGDGNNGKSVLLRAFIAFLGTTNVVNLPLHKIEADRFAASRLVGKLSNICPDLPSEHLTSTSIFKAITGGDPIPAEYKYKDSFDVLPFCKILFSANHPPRSNDASYAFFDRWLVLPFEAVFEEGKAGTVRPEVLAARLAEPGELSGALNRALDAVNRLRQRGAFTVSASMQAAWQQFRATTDPLAVWLDQATVTSPNAYVVRDDLHRAYAGECIRAGTPPISSKSFMAAVRHLRPGLEDGKRKVNGEREWCFLGIGLIDHKSPRPQRAPRSEGVRDVHDVHDLPSCFENVGETRGGEREAEKERIAEMVDMKDTMDIPRAAPAWEEVI